MCAAPTAPPRRASMAKLPRRSAGWRPTGCAGSSRFCCAVTMRQPRCVGSVCPRRKNRRDSDTTAVHPDVARPRCLDHDEPGAGTAFRATILPVSFGFRPGRSVKAALNEACHPLRGSADLPRTRRTSMSPTASTRSTTPYCWRRCANTSPTRTFSIYSSVCWRPAGQRCTGCGGGVSVAWYQAVCFRPCCATLPCILRTSRSTSSLTMTCRARFPLPCHPNKAYRHRRGCCDPATGVPSLKCAVIEGSRSRQPHLLFVGFSPTARLSYLNSSLGGRIGGIVQRPTHRHVLTQESPFLS